MALANYFRWKDPHNGKYYKTQVVLQIRIKPDSYRAGEERMLPPSLKEFHDLDPHMSNDEIEWTTKQRGAAIPTGLLTRLVQE